MADFGTPACFTHGALATEFPTVWRNLSTADRERMRMLALRIEDVLIKQHQITAAARFRGGAQAAQNGALIAADDIAVPEGASGARSSCRLLEQRGILLPAK